MCVFFPSHTGWLCQGSSCQFWCSGCHWKHQQQELSSHKGGETFELWCVCYLGYLVASPKSLSRALPVPGSDPTQQAVCSREFIREEKPQAAAEVTEEHGCPHCCPGPSADSLWEGLISFIAQTWAVTHFLQFHSWDPTWWTHFLMNYAFASLLTLWSGKKCILHGNNWSLGVQ